MDYRREIESRNSKGLWIEIFNDIGDDKQKLSLLMELFFSDNKKLSLGASQPIGMIGEKKPKLIKPYLSQMILHLNSNPVNGVKRNILRTFQFNEIPKENEGVFFDIVFNYIKSIDEAYAIKAFSITILRKLCVKYPELTQEVIPTIEILVQESDSPGIISRGTKELKILRII